MAGLRAIIPKDVVNAKAFQRELTKAVNDVTSVMVKDFGRTTRTWDHKPKFYQVGADGSISGAAGADDKIFEYVTRGTVPHVIRPKRAKILRFNSGYRAKSGSRVIGSHQGGSTGEPVFAKVVHHPGTTAREFEEEIAGRRQRTLENFATAAILRASKA